MRDERVKTLSKALFSLPSSCRFFSRYLVVWGTQKVLKA